MCTCLYLQVTVAVLGAAPVTIIPETTIPLNRAQCPHTTQPTTTRTSTPLRMPSPTPRASKTSALFQLSMTQSLLAVSSSRPPMGTFYTAASVTSTSSSIMVSPPKLPAGTCLLWVFYKLCMCTWYAVVTLNNPSSRDKNLSLEKSSK